MGAAQKGDTRFVDEVDLVLVYADQMPPEFETAAAIEFDGLALMRNGPRLLPIIACGAGRNLPRWLSGPGGLCREPMNARL